jgi:hypothetical protein
MCGVLGCRVQEDVTPASEACNLSLGAVLLVTL